MRLNFYLPDYNIAIECQGFQHYKADDYTGGEEGFKTRQIRDELKLKLCTEHNIPILYYSGKKYKDVDLITNLNDLLKCIQSYKK